MSFRTLLDSTNFLVIGHRGAAGLEAENTLPSFSRAVDFRCHAIELDVQCSKQVADQPTLWVIHDDTVDRTTNGKGRISCLTDRELHTLRCVNKAQIPTLRDVLDFVIEQPTALAVNVELKGKGTAEHVAALIKDYPDIAFLVSSFDHNELRTFRSVDSNTDVAPLFHRWQDNAVAVARGLSACCVNLAERLTTEARCRHIRQHGLAVLTYTVNTVSTARRLEAMGVAGIFTDRPDRFAHYLSA